MTAADPAATLREQLSIGRIRTSELPEMSVPRDAPASRARPSRARPSRARPVLRDLSYAEVLADGCRARLRLQVAWATSWVVIGQAGNLMPPLRASFIRRVRSDAFSLSVAVFGFTPAASYMR